MSEVKQLQLKFNLSIIESIVSFNVVTLCVGQRKSGHSLARESLCGGVGALIFQNSQFPVLCASLIFIYFTI